METTRVRNGNTRTTFRSKIKIKRHQREGNEYTSEEESKVGVNLDKLLGSMGMGIDSQVCLNKVNDILCTRTQETYFKTVNRSIVHHILKMRNYCAIL